MDTLTVVTMVTAAIAGFGLLADIERKLGAIMQWARDQGANI